MGFLKNFLHSDKSIDDNLKTIAYLANLDSLGKTHPEIAKALINELKQQRASLKLIASENYCSLDVQLAMGNLLTDKYAEGYPHHRFYAGCENVDTIEEAAVSSLKSLFGAEHAYVQPHSGADANIVAFWGILIKSIETPFIEKVRKKSIYDLTPEEYEKMRQLFSQQKILGMSLDCGGHLTHGSRVNLSSKMMQALSYGVDPKTERVDYKKIEEIAVKEKPLILLAGYSAYPRLLDFAKMREIADKAGSTLLVDMAHFSGLVAGKALTGNFNPIPFAHVVTSTTHKTLRGPRGGMILCQEEFREFIDKGCPHVLGGPLNHVIAAKLIAFKEALKPDFQAYATNVIKNAKALAERFNSQGIKLYTGGTDNHLIVVDVQSSFGLTGRQAESALSMAGMTLNRNTIPNDPNGAWYCSGIRLGPPALTTRGLREKEMHIVADLIIKLLKATKKGSNEKTGEPSLAKIVVDEKVLKRVQEEINELLSAFPLYPEIEIGSELLV